VAVEKYVPLTARIHATNTVVVLESSAAGFLLIHEEFPGALLIDTAGEQANTHALTPRRPQVIFI